MTIPMQPIQQVIALVPDLYELRASRRESGKQWQFVEELVGAVSSVIRTRMRLPPLPEDESEYEDDSPFAE